MTLTPKQINVDAIIAGLSEAERAAVRCGECAHEIAVSQRVEPLWRVITKHRQGLFRITLNPLGLAVRAKLEARDNG